MFRQKSFLIVLIIRFSESKIYYELQTCTKCDASFSSYNTKYYRLLVHFRFANTFYIYNHTQLSSLFHKIHSLNLVSWFQGLWFDKDSSLWMLPCMNADLVTSLSKRGIYSIQELLDIPKAALQTVTENFPASRLYQVKVPHNLLF